ncbi:response regulator transcription factor [Bacillus sp. 165]|uniref:response regulator transcription factor n=1 Tax=Bacillus sp. 165 TaxID=1529117 RepID=UPI001ADD478F|nr:response regulator transcription factor [Bacillus sp. 165]MBO9131170.1 response regulator transcription factor [Bacillus sp. 165]
MAEETILVVDDDEKICNLVSIYLQNDGYKVITVHSGKAAVQVVNEQDIALIVLDVMMPEKDGIETCLAIREQHHMPIIFLSAKAEDMDKIHGLSTGADDYITKPFNPLELLARVKSQLRRYRKYNDEDKYSSYTEIGNLKVNEDTRQVFVGDKEIRLTPKEFDILSLLVRNKGKVFSLEKIYEMVWQEEFYKSDNTIMVHITRIREKIEEDPKRPIYIKTVWGVGYKI